MVRQNLIEPIALIAVGIAIAVYAAIAGIAVLFACACLVVALGWFEFRQTSLFNRDVEKLAGRDAAEPE